MRKFTDICYTDSRSNMQMLDMYLPDTDGFPVFVFFTAEASNTVTEHTANALQAIFRSEE